MTVLAYLMIITNNGRCSISFPLIAVRQQSYVIHTLSSISIHIYYVLSELELPDLLEINLNGVNGSALTLCRSK